MTYCYCEECGKRTKTIMLNSGIYVCSQCNGEIFEFGIDVFPRDVEM